MDSLARNFSWFSSLLVGLFALLSVEYSAAQSYPSQPVTLIAGFGAGGEVHRTAHLMGQWLSERLGQPFVIENRVGDFTNVATEAVVRAPADGHTLLVINTANAINAALYDKLNFNFMRDIALVAGLVRIPIVLVVNPSLPATTVPELIAYAKANPGKLKMAGPTITLALASTSFAMMTGLDVAHVLYSGDATALKNLLAGELQTQFAGLGATKGYIAAGKVRALAVGSATRERGLPDTPTIGEFIPRYEMSAWLGIGAPKNTRPEIVAKLNNEIAAGLSHSKVQSHLAEEGHVPMPMTSAQFEKFVAQETERLGKLVKLTGIKPQ
jgi:tripartite-type tricarboxylate transporter receptor subunit TctC